MPRRLSLVLPLALTLFVAACGSSRPALTDAEAGPVDAQATVETRALYANLKRLAPDHVLFGHQDDLAYGVDWKREAGRSDVRDTGGSYPAVYGWELGNLEHGRSDNLDGVRFDDMQRWIRAGYRRGGVITLSWHMDNPASGGSSWDTTRAIHTILPGGGKHALYVDWLDRFAAFVDGLHTGVGAERRPIPVIFRPFHEHTGSWFWWGGANVTADEYVRLWRFTFDYLQNEKGLHNLLWAYSTDRFETPGQYWAFYPGDAYVDILGFDDYHSVRTEAGGAVLAERFAWLVGQAEARGKVAAFTETGLEGVPDPTFWTGRLLRAIETSPQARGIAYVMVWRNANAADLPGHFYAPHPGHPSVEDFVRFRQHPVILFEDDLPPMYRMP